MSGELGLFVNMPTLRFKMYFEREKKFDQANVLSFSPYLRRFDPFYGAGEPVAGFAIAGYVRNELLPSTR